MRKRAFSLLLALALILSVTPVTVFAEVIASGNCGAEGAAVEWQFDNTGGVLTISGAGAMADYTAGSQPAWYDQRANITSVSISDGVTSIGDWVFSNCTGLNNITIPDSVTSIGMSAFMYCDNLSNVTIPKGVATIGDAAFYYCYSLNNIEIPDSVTAIGISAFQNCTSLTSIVIPSSVTSIGKGAFLDCTGLTSVALPSGLTTIETETFWRCTSLTSVTIPKTLTQIEDKAFLSCVSLANVYYYGDSAEEWGAITISATDNDALDKAKIWVRTPEITVSEPTETDGALVIAVTADRPFKDPATARSVPSYITLSANETDLTLSDAALDTSDETNKTMLLSLTGESTGGDITVTFDGEAFDLGPANFNNNVASPAVTVPVGTWGETTTGPVAPPDPDPVEPDPAPENVFLSMDRNTIPRGTVDPDVTITVENAAFGPGSTDPSNYTFWENTTGLTIGSITKNSDLSVTIHFQGTAQPGTMSLDLKQDVFYTPESLGTWPAFVITVPAPSSSGGSSGGGGGSSTPTPAPTPKPVIPETVPSPIQDEIIRKDEPDVVDWIERVDVPEYAEKLYNVMAGRPAAPDNAATTATAPSVFEEEKNFDLENGAGQGEADVEFVEEVTFDLREMYAQEADGEPEVKSTIFEDERFYTVSVSDADKRVNYAALQMGDVVRTAKFNGLYVTSIPKDAGYDAKKKETCEYIAAVYQAFDRDCPEIFWLSGKCKARIMSTTSSDGTKTAYFFLVLADDSGFSMRTPAWEAEGAIAAGVQRRDAAVAEILTTVTSGEVVEQVKQLNQWLTEHNQYNTTPDLTTIGNEPHECLSALEGRIDRDGPVCDGYSRAFKVLCDRLGIPCVLETGWAMASVGSTPEFHMWSNVQVGDMWYAADITWDDPSVKGFVGAKSGKENENFLLVGSDTVVLGQPFQNSHVVKNQAAVGGVDFNNGPILSPIAFAPVAYSGGYYVALFDDVPVDHWAAEACAWAKSMGYMVGTSESTFGPDSPVTREQIWIVLNRLAGNSFTSYEAVHEWAVRNGIADGSEPQQAATRQEALTFLYRLAQLKGYPTAQRADLSAYTDADQIAPWAQDPLAWAVGNGLITGTSPNTASPEGRTNRAQFALILQNLFKKVVDA